MGLRDINFAEGNTLRYYNSERDIQSESLAVGSSDEEAYLFDTVTADRLQKDYDPSGGVNGVAVNDWHFCFGSSDNNVYVKNVVTGSDIRTHTEASNSIKDLDCTESHLVSASSSQTYRAYDFSDGSLLYSKSPVSSTAIDNSCGINDSYFAGDGDSNHNCFVWSLSDGSQTYELKQESNYIRTVAMNNDYVAYGGDTGEVYVHDLSDGSLTYTLTQASFIYAIAFNSSQIAYTDGSGEAYLHDLSNGSLTTSWTPSGADNIFGAGMNDKYFGFGGTKDQVWVVDLSTNNIIHNITEFNNNVQDVDVDSR